MNLHRVVHIALIAELPFKKNITSRNYFILSFRIAVFLVNHDLNLKLKDHCNCNDLLIFYWTLKPLTQHGYGMEEEVIRILKKTPKWKPAIKDGQIKKANRKQTVSFVVQ